jgi:thymidine phosphorylase
LDDGRAWSKFQRICDAQGGLREPPVAAYRQPMLARHGGALVKIDNRKLAKLAKLAGAPEDKAAGLELHVRCGQTIRAGDPLCTIHAESSGELAYAMGYADVNSDTFILHDA